MPRLPGLLPLHFLLRFSDRLFGVDTYAEHKAVEARFGQVWWGKIGLGISRDVLRKAQEQISRGMPTYVYLATERRIRYRGRLLELLGGGIRSVVKPKDTSRIPKYYRRERCSVWFRLNGLRSIVAKELRHLVLYHDPHSIPQLGGMRGLIYVSMGTPGSRDAGTVRTSGGTPILDPDLRYLDMDLDGWSHK